MEILVRISYFVIPIIALAITAINHFFVSYGMVWYKELVFPSFTPPRWFIEIMWQIIYVLTTISVVIVWNHFKRNMRFLLIMALFLFNAAANVYWHYLFFYQKEIGMAIIESLFLQLTVLLLIFLIWPVSRLIAWFFILYAAWEFFAIFWTIIIWVMN
ncbi:MAG: tryptophan-rich sensory protein [Candidatus Babeliales bacterium]|jgi:translocator protein